MAEDRDLFHDVLRLFLQILDGFRWILQVFGHGDHVVRKISTGLVKNDERLQVLADRREIAQVVLQTSVGLDLLTQIKPYTVDDRL